MNHSILAIEKNLGLTLFTLKKQICQREAMTCSKSSGLTQMGSRPFQYGPLYSVACFSRPCGLSGFLRAHIWAHFLLFPLSINDIIFSHSFYHLTVWCHPNVLLQCQFLSTPDFESTIPFVCFTAISNLTCSNADFQFPPFHYKSALPQLFSIYYTTLASFST